MESREVHIKHLLDIGAVKDWNREDAIKTGAKILSGRFVDDAHKEKSRWCAEEFATCKDSSVFAAASDVDNTSLISLLPVKRDHGILCFDAVTASGQVPETELIFIEATCRAQSKSWSTRIVAMPESERRQTERSESVARSLRGDTAIEGVPRSFQAEPEVPDESQFEIALDLHVDDGSVTGPAEKMMDVFACLETKIILKLLSVHHQSQKLVRACWCSEGYR